MIKSSMVKKILIIEDEKDISLLYQIKFKKIGFDVEVADNWFSAYNKMKNDNFRPDVVLLDIILPWMDGFETYKILNKEFDFENVVVLTNLSENYYREKASKLWINVYMTKLDYTPKEIVEKVIDLIG